MKKRITIQQLLAVGCKQQDIADQLQCHRNTVGNIKKEDPLKDTVDRKPSPHPLDPHRQWITDKLTEKLSLIRIYQELSEQFGYQGSYDALRRYAKSRQLKSRREAYTILHTAPGEEAQVDFGYFGITADNSGRRRKTWVFVMTLGFSRLGFYCHTYDQSTATFLECHRKAFEYFGGVPKQVKIDNLKAAVLERERYSITYNEQYKAFAKHYGFIIHPCTVRKPEQKGKVESGVKYVKNNFFAGRNFSNEDDLKARLKEWQDKTANRRTHGTTGEIPAEMFGRHEKNHLRPLPERKWEVLEYATRKVSKTCHVIFEKNYYSVPYQYIEQEITLAAGNKLVTFYNQQHEPIATHLRVVGATGTYQTETGHYPPHKSKSQTEYQAEHAEAMQNIGGHAAEFFDRYKAKQGPYWSRGVKGIIALADRYDRHVVDLACKRALEFEVCSYVVVRRICEKGLWKDGMDVGGYHGRGEEKTKAGMKMEMRVETETGTGTEMRATTPFVTATKQSLLRPLAYYAKLYLIYVFFFFLHSYATLDVDLHVRLFA